MTDRLPLLSAQLAFGLQAQRSAGKTIIALRFRTAASQMSTVDVRQVLQSIMLRNPALSYQIRFSRGVAYQEWHPADCDFAELRAENAEAASRMATAAVEEFERDIDGPAVAARLLRAPEGDDLVLVFDHALVDEQSLLTIKGQLGTPALPDGRERARYEAAVHDRRAFETAAADGPGVTFWSHRLGSVREGFPQVNESPTQAVRVVELPLVAVPRSFRGSLFPSVLFSLHRALQDVAAPGATVIGYPWGGRNGAFSDVVGCFMNTVVSLDTAAHRSAAGGVNEFVQDWFEEIDHADVPFTALMRLGSAFTGAVTAYLGYSHSASDTVDVAGTEAVEVPMTHGRIPGTSAFLAAATVRGAGVRLRLILDEDTVGYRAQELGTRWCDRLSTAISVPPEQRP